LLLAFLGEVLFAVWQRFPPETTPAPSALVGGPRAVGELLFRTYVLPFEVTSILILVAMLGAVVLAKKRL
jgi:NADH-quinone oxidoreductase subunit J